MRDVFAPTPLYTAAISPNIADELQMAEDAERRAAWGTASEHYQAALDRLGPGADPVFAAKLTRHVARCYIHAADFDTAIATLARARAIALAGNDRTGVAHAINLQGVAEWQRGNLGVARERYLEAREIAEQESARAVSAMISQNLGIIANIQGDYAAASAYYEASLAEYEALGMGEKVGPLLNNLGMLYTDLGEWRAAERSFAQAVVRASANQDPLGILLAQANRVELYLQLRRYRKAKRVCRSVLARAAWGAHGEWIGETYKHLGVIYRETNDLDQATTYFDRAMVEADRREDLLLRAETLREMAVLYRVQGRTQETLTALNRSHEIFGTLTARRDILDIDKRLRTLETSFLEIVRRWGSSIESKDRYTQGHCERVAEVGCMIAADAGVPDGEMLWFRMGGLLHDVGKVMVPDEVLNKAGKLNEEEWLLMKEHPAAGERLVADANFPHEVLPMIRHHHERWDGNGYPDRLAGEATPFWARILCIADVWDALTTTRSYRKAFSPAEAVTIMRADSGRAFDPALLDIFLHRTMPRALSHRHRLSQPSLPVVGQIAVAV